MNFPTPSEKESFFQDHFHVLEMLLEDSLINQSDYKKEAIRALELTWFWASKALQDEREDG